MAAAHARLCLAASRQCVQLSSCSEKTQVSSEVQAAQRSTGRRQLILLSSIASCVLNAGTALARDRRSRTEIPIEQYKTNGDGVKYFDLEEGKGPAAKTGDVVLVHFDCIFRGIDAVSSRESKILGGNRIIAEPYELVIGSTPGIERKREFVENANGLFSAQAAPKPPPVLYKVVEGMRVGGKRKVIVTPDIGYGSKGRNEIPPNATFDMTIELLEMKKQLPQPQPS